MLTLSNVLHLLPYEFACLSGRRFAFSFIFFRTFKSFLLWHLLPPERENTFRQNSLHCNEAPGAHSFLRKL